MDDKVVFDCHKNQDNILIFVDKDFFGVNDIVGYNVNSKEMVKTGKGLGTLNETSTGIKGKGRKFFYHQILSGDASDNYFSNSASDVKWGDASSFKALVNCKTDKECWQSIVDCYKGMYPSPKTIKGWRGDDININWLYVLQENATMAHMLRNPDDKINVEAILEKLDVRTD